MTSLREAEETLVARCTTDPACLRLCLSVLPEHPFRSMSAIELGQAFYLLAGWLAQGTYSESRNETRLAYAFAEIETKNGYEQGPLSYAGMLEQWWHGWTPWTVAPEEVRALLDSVVLAYRLDDEALGAIRSRRYAYPFVEETPTPTNPTQGLRRPMRQARGGVA